MEPFDLSVVTLFYQLMKDNNESFKQFLHDNYTVSRNLNWIRLHIVHLMCMAKVFAHIYESSKIVLHTEIPQMFESLLIRKFMNAEDKIDNAYLKSILVVLLSNSFEESDIPYLSLFLPSSVAQTAISPFTQDRIEPWVRKLLYGNELKNSRFMLMKMPRVTDIYDKSQVFVSINNYFSHIGMKECPCFLKNDHKQIFGYNLKGVRAFINAKQKAEVGEIEDVAAIPILGGPQDGTIFRVVQRI